MAVEWFVHAKGREHGPFSSQQLKQLASRGQIGPETPVKQGAGGQWVRARRVKGLFETPAPTPSPTPKPRPAAAPVEELVEVQGVQEPACTPRPVPQVQPQRNWAENDQAVRPEDITRYVVSHFAEVSEKQIADASLAILTVNPHSPQIHLLYALRVSKCVPTLKHINTLASRWSAANRGPQGGGGLQDGRESREWEVVNGFLGNLYLRRFHGLCEEAAGKAKETASKRSTAAAKANAYQKAIWVLT